MGPWSRHDVGDSAGDIVILWCEYDHYNFIVWSLAIQSPILWRYSQSGTGDHSLVISLFHATWRLSQHPALGLGPAALTGITIPALHLNIVKQNLDLPGSYFYHRATGGGTQMDWHQSCMWTKSSNECVLCIGCSGHVAMLQYCHLVSWQFAPLQLCTHSHLFVFTDLTN